MDEAVSRWSRPDVIVVTGAGGGLGGAILKELESRGLSGMSIAVYRTTPTQASDVSSVPCDFSLASSVTTATETLSLIVPGGSIAWILAAGVYGPAGIDCDVMPQITDVMSVNVFGQLALVEGVRRSRPDASHHIVAISSGMGSVANVDAQDRYLYGASKAAMNLCVRQMARNHPRVGCTIVNPGWMRTRMGGPDAPLDPSESARRVVDLVLRRRERPDPAHQVGQLQVDDEGITPW